MRIKKFNQKQIQEFKKLGVQTVYLFGSHATKTAHKLSDVDFGVVFADPKKYKGNTLDVYNKLYDVFTDVLPKSYLRERFKMKVHECDIVFLQFAPISLQFEAIKNSKVLYDTSRENRFKYQEYVMQRNADLQYFYEMRYKAILDRI